MTGQAPRTRKPKSNSLIREQKKRYYNLIREGLCLLQPSRRSDYGFDEASLACLALIKDYENFRKIKLEGQQVILEDFLANDPRQLRLATAFYLPRRGIPSFQICFMKWVDFFQETGMLIRAESIGVLPSEDEMIGCYRYIDSKLKGKKKDSAIEILRQCCLVVDINVDVIWAEANKRFSKMRKKQREDGIPFAIGFPAISEASVEIEPLSDNIEVVSGPQAIQLTTALPCELSKQVRQETTPPAKPFFGITLGFVKAPRNDDVVAATAAFETKAAAVTPDGIRLLNEEEGEKLTCVNAQPVRLNSPAISLANALNQYDPSDLSTARSVIDRCAGHELWNLMAALNKFHTFLPKSFFGGVPSGMDSVIAMFKKSQPTADVLLHLKTVAKTRAQVNGCILNTRNAKTIEAYQAINDFFEDGSAPASENTAIAALIKKLNNIAKPLPQPIAVRATA